MTLDEGQSSDLFSAGTRTAGTDQNVMCEGDRVERINPDRGQKD